LWVKVLHSGRKVVFRKKEEKEKTKHLAFSRKKKRKLP